MNNQRRSFLAQMSVMAGVATLNKPLTSVAAVSKRLYTLHAGKNVVTIYHTNDIHGKMDAAYYNMGGINQLKVTLARQETGGLLVDAGDFLHGSQSLAEQRAVISVMNNMGYHAAAVGNHELAKGQQHLASLIPLMQFSMVNCNYEFEGSLSDLIKPYIIINSGKYKVGITGVGHKIAGIGYRDAIQSANTTAAFLKENEQCHLVICLSHLGFKQDGDTPDNQKLARQSEHIDLIVSGHNQQLLAGQLILRNKLKNEVILAQTAWDGLMMGRTIFNFDSNQQKNGLRAKYIIPGQPAGQTFAESLSVIKAKEQVA